VQSVCFATVMDITVFLEESFALASKTSVTKKAKGRVRGGASAPCPQCGNATRVLDTRRTLDGQVQRLRQCLANPEHTFTTVEVPS
jgi:hypothetical protein